MTAAVTASTQRKRVLDKDDDNDIWDMRHCPIGEYGYEAVASVSDALESARPGGLALAYLIIG